MDGLNSDEQHVVRCIAAAGSHGVHHAALLHSLSEVMEKRSISTAIRSLVSLKKLACVRLDGGEYLLTLRKAPLTEHFAFVLDVISSAGSSGIDALSVVQQTKLPKPEVTKALAQLVQSNYVKETRCFTNKTRKLYILAELEPSSEVTGGTFYTEGRDIDTHLIDTLRVKIVRHLKSRSTLSLGQIQQLLESESAAGEKTITAKDLQILLNTLILDGLVMGKGGQYRLAVARHERETLRSSFPCLGCPLLSVCSGTQYGVINPHDCAYLTEFLS